MADAKRGHRAKPIEVFQETRLWIFDLDNTLYPAECNLFAQIDARMMAFIQNLLGVDAVEARRIQKHYYHHYGTTLAGLMKEHGVKPEDFMDFVHDIDLAVVAEAPELGQAIASLEGRKFIFTNGSRRHAERVAEKLGILNRFDGIFDIAASSYVPKPKPEAFQKFLSFCGEDKGSRAAMFEDLPHNLLPAHVLGMTTVLVHSTFEDHPSQAELRAAEVFPEHIHFAIPDLALFLEETRRVVLKAAAQTPDSKR